MPDLLPAPRDEEIARLPLFDGLSLSQITWVDDAGTAQRARQVLSGQTALGFDTESKPTFARNQVSQGPHLVQFATDDHAYLFPTSLPAGVEVIVSLLEQQGLLKVGFGLAGDRQLIARRFDARTADLVDLDQQFRELGFRRSMGVKAAVAVVLGKRFVKSKKIATSDWSRPQLDERQREYAANDAYAALCVHRAFDAAALRSRFGVSARPAQRLRASASD